MVQHIPPHGIQDIAIKASGVIGGGSAFAGLALDLSGWSEISQIVANFGIGLGSVVAAMTFIYTLYKGKKK